MGKNKQSLYIHREDIFTYAFLNNEAVVPTKYIKYIDDYDVYNFAFGVGLIMAAFFPEEIDKLIEGIEWARTHNIKQHSGNSI